MRTKPLMTGRLWAHPALLLAALSASLAGCVRERTLFDDASPGQAGTSGAGTTDGGAGARPANEGGALGAGASGAPSAGAPPANEAGTGAAPWEEKTCIAALSLGKSGDPCVDTFKCTATTECCGVTGFCTGGELTIQNGCGLCTTACTTDADCGAGRLCDGYACRDCPSDACPDDWQVVIRNSCKVCVPPTECKEKGGCAVGEICVAGSSCLPNCKGDPACCFGNQCADAACGPPDGVDCLLVGCPPGSFCKVAGPAVECSCDVKTGKWSCASPPSNACVAY